MYDLHLVLVMSTVPWGSKLTALTKILAFLSNTPAATYSPVRPVWSKHAKIAIVSC